MTIDQHGGLIPTWTKGDRLRKSREMTGLTQAAFAKEIDVSHRTVTNYEKELVEPRTLALKAWSLRTGVSLHWLMTGEAPPPSGDGASVRSLLSESNRRPFHYMTVIPTELATA